MKARDGGGRESPQEAELTFEVIRNQNAPEFIGLPYETVIFYTRPVSNDPIWDVNATDTDQYRIVNYTLIGDGPEVHEYFAVDPVTGFITLIKPLTNTSTTVFYVSIFWCN